ncbi:hypothetical protein DOM22_07915 [Bdellovibrio sp. ZAP7]|uniref:HNH endonuclease n=1 Tax=Bdellovibrio sp. ZAP7 TaxID=2231053 RepID=UPI00115A4562|nr:HNH endonuclease signature motif containing protein [Bdellovibrio sp. ZAP7]QDK45089.1 hypothetical protein DOM22_07915 [Bdellovibrio sp. ZAP7]
MNKLSKMNNDELEASFKVFVTNERKILHIILEHVKEIDSRRLFLERGFDSTLSYLIHTHGYSKTAAEKRLYAARLLRDVPEMAAKVEEGRLNLSQLCQVSSAIKQKERVQKYDVSLEEKASLLARVDGKNCWDTQKELSSALDLPLKPTEKQLVQKDESVHLQLTLSKEQYELLVKSQELGFHLLQQNRDHSLAGLIEVLCSQFIRLKEVGSKCANSNGASSKGVESAAGGVRDLREVLLNKREGSVVDCNGIGASNKEAMQIKNTETVSMASHNKTITPKTRQFVLMRDRCCQYVDKSTGLICESKMGLQVDHIIPRWAGGDNSEENLQALCGQHNRLRYRQQAGVVIS